jgi:hypothetical protein
MKFSLTFLLPILFGKKAGRDVFLVENSFKQKISL